MFLDWRYPIEHIGELLSGAWMTAQISVICFIASLLLGTLCSIVRFSKKPKILYVFVSAFVEIMRNTPLLVQLFFVFFGIPQIGISLSPWTAGVLVLSLNSAAYYCEIMRGGIQSIPKGQWEAAESLCLSKTSAFIRVIFPQAVRDAFPSIANQLVLLIFGTSVLSILDVRELTQTASILNSQSFRSMEIFTFVMLFYYAVTALILLFTRLAYKKWFASKTERR
ncbi:MAG TPA: amino acid ABC transporter permease [Firmicutes bacterium]|nr:amino acid ABC transporter permease [Bacillota bacterium]